MAKKFEAELGLNLDDFGKGLENAKEGIKSLGKEMLSLGGFIAVAAGAAKSMVDWFNQTEAGANSMNVALRVSHQLLTDIMMGQQLHLGKAIELADEENRIREGNRYDLVKEAELNRDIRQYRIDAYDATKSLADRIESQNKAIEKQKELEAYIKEDLREELRLVNQRLEIDPINTKLLDEQARLTAEIYNADASESLRMISYKNTLLKEQNNLLEQERAWMRELGELGELRDYGAAMAKQSAIIPLRGKITGITGPGNKLSETENEWTNPSQFEKAINNMNKSLSEQQNIVMNLTGVFSNMFSNIDKGFKNMIGSLINEFNRWVSEIMAKAFVSIILGAIFPGSQIATFALNAWRQTIPGKMTSGLPIGNSTLNINGVTSGKSLQYVLRRAE